MERIDEANKDLNEMSYIKEYLVDNKIICEKYNYSLDEAI